MATTPAAADLSKVHKLCIVTLLRILDNIINDINTPPERKNARIRKIKTTGPFHDRAGQWEGSIEFLLECGFQRTTNSQLKLMEDNPSRLLAGRKELVRFAVEQLGLLESKLPDCPVLDEIVAPTNPNSPAIEDAVALGTEDNNACEITKSYADRSDTEYDGNQSNACLSLESSSGGVNVAVVNDSGLSTENGDGQHVIQSSKDEITPTHQHQQQDEQLPRNQLPQDPTVQQIPDDVPSQSNISASDSMSSLLDEIEMELNGDSSFFLGDYSGEHHHEEILGDGEIASSSSIAEGLPEHAQMQLETLFAADVCFMDEFSLARTHIMPEEEDNEDTLPAELDESKEQVHLLDNSNNVRLEQTKHVESEDGTDVNANRTIVPIARDDDHIALILPEVVEEMLLLQQPNNEITIPPPESCRGHVDSTTTSETAPIDKETADIVHFHGRNKSASDLLIYLDSENETGNGVDNTTDITSSFPLQQEHRYGDDDIGLNGNEQSMSEFDRAPSDGADSTLRHQNDLIDEDHADLNTPPPGSLSDDSDMYTYYRSLFNRISPPEGEFSFANENDDIMQYRHGFELCHRALFSVWVESIRRTDASKYKISGRSKHVDPLAGLTNLLLHKRSEMDQDCSAEGKSLLGYVSSERPILLVPLDVAYASWACILDLNSDDESNNNDFRISSDGSAAGKMYSWIVSNHRHLCVVDDNIPPAQESMLPKRARSRLENICNFVCKSLRDIGLISLFSANISVGMSDDSTLYIGVEGFESKDNIPRNRDEIVPKWDDRSMLSKCHSILSRLVYPTLLDELDFVNQSDISRVSTYGVLCWYSCHFLVDHLIESGQLTTARSLLSDTRFIRLRVNYLGCFSGASIHCRDCSRLAHCLSRSQKNNHFAEDSWREPSPSSNAEGFEDGKSILTDNHKAGIAGWSEYHFKILCSVSAVLRGRVETLSQEENEARMDIGQSMKIIGECIGEIGPYYVQEMEHYEEAFRLLTEAYGQDQNHEAIADILVSCMAQPRFSVQLISSFSLTNRYRPHHQVCYGLSSPEI